MTDLWQWASSNGTLLGWLGGLSALMFVGTLVAVPIVVARIPADYFSDPQRHFSRLHRMHPVVYVAMLLMKNLLGWTLFIAGIAMLVLPGQGLLTILVGLWLMDFPGKFALERHLVARPGVFRSLNWIRQKTGSEPLIHPDLS